MTYVKPMVAASLVTLVFTAFAQSQGPARQETLVISGDNAATIDWIQKSDVSPLIDGNVESIEVEQGATVLKNSVIGQLYTMKAQLSVEKAKVAAEAAAPESKATAQRDQAASVVARNERLVRQNPNLVSDEDREKAKADLNYADALLKEAGENKKLAKAELKIAEQILEEHKIRAPFAGIVLEKLKQPGEAVRSNEAVLRIGNLDKLRAYAFIPLNYADRVSEGTVVEIQPIINGSQPGTSGGIDSKKFRGVITFVDPNIQPVAETAVRIYADFKNESHELRPGLKATMTIYIHPPGQKPAANAANRAAAPTAEARAGTSGLSK